MTQPRARAGANIFSLSLEGIFMTLDVSGFLGGRWLTHVDLPTPYQVCTITGAKQELVGDDPKIVVYFAQHQKGLGCNKTNLRRLVGLHGVDAGSWKNKQLLVYRSSTTFQGQTKLCVRVCGPQEAPPDAVCDSQGAAVLYQPVAAVQPVAQQPTTSTPVPASPWKGDSPPRTT
jgi:hypothetical protein